MTVINPSPVFMADATFLVPTDDYAAALTSVALVPTNSVVSVKGLKPGAVFSRTTSSTWTLDITFFQDFAPTSLWTYLFNNAGNQVTVTIEPETDGPSFTATVNLAEAQAGGSVDGFPTASVSLGVVGKPTLIPAA